MLLLDSDANPHVKDSEGWYTLQFICCLLQEFRLQTMAFLIQFVFLFLQS